MTAQQRGVLCFVLGTPAIGLGRFTSVVGANEVVLFNRVFGTLSVVQRKTADDEVAHSETAK